MTRYADGPTAEARALVHAPLDGVWRLVTDISVPARFSTELREATWLDDGPALGARFVGRSEHPALGEWTTTSWVDRFEPMRSFGWVVSDPEAPSASWWFTLDEPEGGVVALALAGRMGPAPSGLSIAISAMPEKEERIVARRLEEWERNLQATVDGIKGLAESGEG
jgi:hypothetical protein